MIALLKRRSLRRRSQFPQDLEARAISFTVCALALPALPPLDVINKRLNKELFRLRRHERRANWETLLRQRGEVLYRLCASFCWELE